MAVRAVVFDTGDVLEIIGPASWTGAWCRELGMTQAQFDAAADRVDPDNQVVTGGIDEAELRLRYASELDLSPDQLRLPPREVVFVDDLQSNVDAAASIGMLAVRHRDTADTIATLDLLLQCVPVDDGSSELGERTGCAHGGPRTG